MKWYWIILIAIIVAIVAYQIAKARCKQIRTVITIDKNTEDLNSDNQRQVAQGAVRGVRNCNCGQTVTTGNTTTSYRGLWNGSSCIQSECL